jgi:hypothetical protein
MQPNQRGHPSYGIVVKQSVVTWKLVLMVNLRLKLMFPSKVAKRFVGLSAAF